MGRLLSATLGALLTLFALVGLAAADQKGPQIGGAARQGVLTARPLSRHAGAEPAQGTHELRLGGKRDGQIHVPASYRPGLPAPLLVLLHGAGAEARSILPAVQAYTDAAGVILLAPDSRGRTWDIVLGDYGPDVAFIDRALDRIFADYAIDPGRIAIGGFSDGASYALSLGLTNGDLFTHIIAFSPGLMAPGRKRGHPRVFISHGVEDRVLPIDQCSRRIVPSLRRESYAAEYREFDGGHEVPPAIARAAINWLVG